MHDHHLFGEDLFVELLSGKEIGGLGKQNLRVRHAIPDGVLNPLPLTIQRAYRSARLRILHCLVRCNILEDCARRLRVQVIEILRKQVVESHAVRRLFVRRLRRHDVVVDRVTRFMQCGSTQIGIWKLRAICKFTRNQQGDVRVASNVVRVSTSSWVVREEAYAVERIARVRLLVSLVVEKIERRSIIFQQVVAGGREAANSSVNIVDVCVVNGSWDAVFEV